MGIISRCVGTFAWTEAERSVMRIKEKCIFFDAERDGRGAGEDFSVVYYQDGQVLYVEKPPKGG